MVSPSTPASSSPTSSPTSPTPLGKYEEAADELDFLLESALLEFGTSTPDRVVRACALAEVADQTEEEEAPQWFSGLERGWRNFPLERAARSIHFSEIRSFNCIAANFEAWADVRHRSCLARARVLFASCRLTALRAETFCS